MSSIVTSQGIVHYEAYGRGRPVILLHGWINSWGVWQDVMIDLAEHGRYKVYALDFWGFGESGKQNTPPFKVDSYAQMVDQFMEILGIECAPVLGHSMGGTVALDFALKYPHRVTKVGAVGSPIQGGSLNFFLRLAALNWVQLAQSVPSVTRLIVTTLVRINTAGDTARVRKMLLQDVDRTSMESFFRSIGDLRNTDLSGQLGQLSMPVLGVYGRHDNIVDPQQLEVLSQTVRGSQAVMLSQSRHFPMLDEPDQFNATVRQFLAGEAPPTNRV
ncbi:MAG TPA: alpha/beta hydrolase [Anaerolineae bacterium]|nr:alpha/beta hydrolase [Anaerolineae bacterium]